MEEDHLHCLRMFCMEHLADLHGLCALHGLFLLAIFKWEVRFRQFWVIFIRETKSLIIIPHQKAFYRCCKHFIFNICCLNFIGVINSLLSWKAFTPLSRLTYTAYLLHPIVIQIFYSSFETPLHFSNISIVSRYSLKLTKYQQLKFICINFLIDDCIRF